MAVLGNIALGTYNATSSADTAITGSDPVLELVGSESTSTDVHDATNSTHTGVASFQMGNVPGDFGTMDSCSIQLVYAYGSAPSNTTWAQLTAQIYQSDGATALTNEVTVASSITTTTTTTSAVISFTGTDTASNAAVWNNAVVWLRFYIERSKGGDSAEERVYGATITGVYTAGATEVALTGEGGTAGLGSFGLTVDAALTGEAGTSALGSLGQTVALALSGEAGTAGLGAPAAVIAVDLAGEAGTGGLGTLTPQSGAEIALTGIEATAGLGSFSLSADLGLTGEGATAAIGALGPSLNIALGGFAMTGGIGTLTPSASYSVSLTGEEATAGQGAFSLLADITLSGLGMTGYLGTLGILGQEPPPVVRMKGHGTAKPARQAQKRFFITPDTRRTYLRRRFLNA